jgi:Methylamine utilisation protein MauE
MPTIPLAPLLPWLDRIARSTIAVVFLAAAGPKLVDVQAFAAIVNAYAILPGYLVLPTAVAIPVVEVILAVGLLCNNRRTTLGSLLLMVFFILLLSYSIYVGLDIDCGCFGPEDPEYSAFHGLRSALWRDLVLLVPLLYSLWYVRYRCVQSTFYGEMRK